MTKSELLDLINKRFEEQREIIGNAGFSEDLSTEDKRKVLESAGEIITDITNYIASVLPVTPANMPFMVAALRFSATQIECLLDNDEKGAAGELYDMMEELFEATTTVKKGDDHDAEE